MLIRIVHQMHDLHFKGARARAGLPTLAVAAVIPSSNSCSTINVFGAHLIAQVYLTLFKPDSRTSSWLWSHNNRPDDHPVARQDFVDDRRNTALR
jgi:hypothetical protein